VLLARIPCSCSRPSRRRLRLVSSRLAAGEFPSSGAG
jgi:hypothetical protein